MKKKKTSLHKTTPSPKMDADVAWYIGLGVFVIAFSIASVWYLLIYKQKPRKKFIQEHPHYFDSEPPKTFDESLARLLLKDEVQVGTQRRPILGTPSHKILQDMDNALGFA